MMIQFVFDQGIAGNRRKAWWFRKLRDVILKYYDPLVRYELNGQRITLNLSHELPYARYLCPTVSANLTRLSAFIRSRFNNLRMIDVGSNIGDSYWLAGEEPGDEFLLVEGGKNYFDLLTRNVPDHSSVTRVNVLLSDKHSMGKDKLVSSRGSAHISKNDPDTSPVVYQTLDEILGQHPRFNSANLLKSDVDGYDCKVLMGGLNYLATATPIIFFEHHPRLLSLVGENEKYIFKELAALGYGRMIVYDIAGFMLGMIPTNNTQMIDSLILYARCKEDYCFDICCFHDKHALARDEFFATELSFYTKLASTISTI